MRLSRTFAVLASCSLLLGACSSNNTGTSDPGVTPPADTGTAAADTGAVADDTGSVDETPPTPPPYPDGPYDFKNNSVFPNLTLKGYKDAAGEWTDISMADYYDPDGSRGITAIYLVVAAQWCPPCDEEASHLPIWWSRDFKDRGAKFVSFVIQTGASPPKPATQATVDQWIKAGPRYKHALNFDIAADPTSSSLPKTGSVGLPHNYIINPRTMRIFRVLDGIDPAITTPCTTNADCCKASDTSGNCTVDYKCSAPIITCVPPDATGPLAAIEYVLKNNGAPPFDMQLH